MGRGIAFNFLTFMWSRASISKDTPLVGVYRISSLGGGWEGPPNLREIPPGLLQHVLTVLVFWSCVLLLPLLYLGLGASDCSPRLAFCFTGP